LKAGISTGGAVLDSLPPRSGTLKNKQTKNTELTTVDFKKILISSLASINMG